MMGPGGELTASILIVTRNNPATLADAVKACLAQDWPADDYEVLVYDDASGPAQQTALAQVEREAGVAVAAGRLRLMRAAAHGGLCAGRNAAARAARGRVLAYVDGDAYPEPGWLRALLPGFAEGRVGVCASRVVFHRCRDLINGVGGTLNWFATGMDRHALQPVAAGPVTAQYALYAMGCGMAVTRACWEAVSGFDEAIVNYYDDADFGIRAWAHGFKVVTCPAAVVYHDNQGLAASDAPPRAQIEYGRWRTMLKHWPWRMLARSLVYQAHLCRTQGRGAPWRVLARTALALLRDWPAIWRYRRSVPPDAAKSFWGLLDPRHSWMFTALTSDARWFGGRGELAPFTAAEVHDARYFMAIGRLLLEPPVALIDGGLVAGRVAPGARTLTVAYERAAGATLTAAFDGEAGETRETGPAGQLQFAIPSGAARFALRVARRAPAPPEPLWPAAAITLTQASQA